jgi:hypothetical protein
MSDWAVEQDRFVQVAYHRTLAAARKAFHRWHSRTRDDAIAECVAKMWDQWSRLLLRGKDPERMTGTLIKWAVLWVKYDRRIAGRARNIDVFDFRSRMRRQDLDAQGRPHPSDRSDRENGWIDWDRIQANDDPAAWAEAKDSLGL